jgi:predicted ester cyclase
LSQVLINLFFKSKSIIMKKFFLLMALPILFLTACSNDEKKEDDMKEEKVSDSVESKEEKNKETALASVNAFIAGDIDKTLKDITADAVDYGDGSMPAVKSKDSIMVYLKNWRGAFSDYRGDNIMAFADGDYVAVWGDWSGTFKTDFMGMKTAGKKIKIKDVDIFKFNSDSKMTEHYNVQSSAEMMKQLGNASPK